MMNPVYMMASLLSKRFSISSLCHILTKTSHEEQLRLRQKMGPSNPFAPSGPDIPQLRNSLEQIDKFTSVVVFQQGILKECFVLVQDAIRRCYECGPD